MRFTDLFKRRGFGPLSVSPVGLTVFCLFVAAAAVISRGVYEDKEIQSNLYAVLAYARPIAAHVRLFHERSGRFPAALAEIAAAKAQAPAPIARTELLKDGEVRLVFASPPAIANASLTLRVIVRGREHFLECRAEGDFKGGLPLACRPGEAPERVPWPPASGK
ncbi:MAG: hypothetical protein HY017_06590 [Betaproteobacteria bacterium]|nr:hypothetical protein [Betaproteobacteria bacterium]